MSPRLYRVTGLCLPEIRDSVRQNPAFSRALKKSDLKKELGLFSVSIRCKSRNRV